MTWQAIIFDCDGTLVDSESIANEVLIEIAAEHGLALTIEQALAEFRGVQFAECIRRMGVMRGAPLPASFGPDFRSRTQQAFAQRLRAMDGAHEIAGSLTVPRCVASNGPHEQTVRNLAKTGLLPYFGDKVFSAYQVGAWKPDPGLFLHAAAAMNVEPERCAVVEDSVPGVRAGLAAGMTVFAVGCHEDVPGATHVAHLRELRGLFTNAKIAA